MSDIKELKKELKRLYSVEEKLLEFIATEEDHIKIAINQLFEVAELIFQMNVIIENQKRRTNDNSTKGPRRNKISYRRSI